jgi:predicted Fe-S protein YdhL (DUF1289 family)
MDAATGWCEGCLRTLDEIALWSRLHQSDKDKVCALLAARRAEWRRLHPEPPVSAVDGEP